jgi:hypothetical protein
VKNGALSVNRFGDLCGTDWNRVDPSNIRPLSDALKPAALVRTRGISKAIREPLFLAVWRPKHRCFSARLL